MAQTKNILRFIYVLFRYRKEPFQDNIIIGDMWPNNYMVQFDTPSEWRVRIVDDYPVSTWEFSQRKE